MQIENVFLHKGPDGGLQAKATISVPGIGEIKIEHAMSDELCANIKEEVIAALRVRLGQTIVTPNVELRGCPISERITEK